MTDAVVALAATGMSLWVLVAAPEAWARDADLLGVALLGCAGGALVLRRRWPVAVLTVVVVTTTVAMMLGFTGGIELPLVLVALFTVWVQGHRGAGMAVLVLLVGAGGSYRLLIEWEDPLLVVIAVLPLALVAALGDAVRTRHELRVEARERLRILEAEKEREATARMTAERLRVARELHDVLAHTITAIAVQAGAAADGLEEGSEARDTMRSMRSTAQAAMQQLRATIEVLRSEQSDDPSPSAPDITAIATLVDRVRDAGVGGGVGVSLEIEGEVRALPAAVELTAYRIVQEALTNVVRHADAREATVRLVYGPEACTVSVVDDGVGAPVAGRAGPHHGFGITGMRERAQALGGTVQAGPADDGGFRVRAVLPIGRSG